MGMANCYISNPGPDRFHDALIVVLEDIIYPTWRLKLYLDPRKHWTISALSFVARQLMIWDDYKLTSGILSLAVPPMVDSLDAKRADLKAIKAIMLH